VTGALFGPQPKHACWAFIMKKARRSDGGDGADGAHRIRPAGRSAVRGTQWRPSSPSTRARCTASAPGRSSWTWARPSRSSWRTRWTRAPPTSRRARIVWTRTPPAARPPGPQRGPTRAQVRLKEHGAELIEVADNGCGVRPDGYQALTLKYHTSKLRCFGDLQARRRRAAALPAALRRRPRPYPTLPRRSWPRSASAARRSARCARWRT